MRKTDDLLPEAINLRLAFAWLAEQPTRDLKTIEKASLRFNLSPRDEQFLLEEFRTPKQIALHVSDTQLSDSGDRMPTVRPLRQEHLPTVPQSLVVDYDVFISYRRDRDAETARLICTQLQNRHFKVFLDVENLHAGPFDETLLERIREAPRFLVILSRSSLDRCKSPDDWLRREIVCALTNKKTVIPIMMPGFSFPPKKKLTQELRPILLQNGVNYTNEYFGAMMGKIVEYLGAPFAK